MRVRASVSRRPPGAWSTRQGSAGKRRAWLRSAKTPATFTNCLWALEIAMAGIVGCLEGESKRTVVTVDTLDAVHRDMRPPELG